MRKQLLVIFLILSFPLIPARAQEQSKTPAPADDGGKLKQRKLRVYEHADHSFQILYPADWKVEPGKEGSGVLVAFTDENTADSMVLAAIEAKGLSLNDAGKKARETFARANGFKLVDEANVAVNQAPYHRIIYDMQANGGGGPTFRIIGMISVKDDVAYIMKVYSDPQRAKEAEQLALLFCAQFKVTGKPPFAKADPPKPDETAKEVKSAAVSTPAAAPAGAFQAPEHGLRLSFPAGWSLKKSADPTTLLFLFQSGKEPRTILLTLDPIDPTVLPKPILKSETDSALSGLKSIAIPDAKILDSADTKVGIQKAARVTIGGHGGKDKTELRALYLVFQHGDEFISLTARSSLADFDALKESFDAIVTSIELTNPTRKLK